MSISPYLYKTLHPEDTDVTEDEIEDITIKHVLADANWIFASPLHDKLFRNEEYYE